MEEAIQEVREVRKGAFYSALTAEEKRLASLEARASAFCRLSAGDMLSPISESADRMSPALSVQNERAPNYATAARPFYRVEIEKP